MKTVVIAAVMLSTIGCSGEMYYVCSDNVFAEVRYSEPVDCAKSREVTDKAWHFMVESGLWGAPYLKSTVVVVQPVGWWHDDFVDQDVSGIFYPGRIEVGRDYSALAHEMFHAKDYLEFDLPRLLAPMHANWSVDGRYFADATWVNLMTSK